MNIDPGELIGYRVRLVPMQEDHLEALYEASQADEIWNYMPWRLSSLTDVERFVQLALQNRDNGSEFPFVIIDSDSEQLVGSTRFLKISKPNLSLEIGWTWLNPVVWRTRINTECKYLLLKHCFETMHTNRVQIKTDLRNVRSQAAIERLGAVKEGVLRRHRILPDGYIRDSVVYSIIDEEWPTVKSRLQEFLHR